MARRGCVYLLPHPFPLEHPRRSLSQYSCTNNGHFLQHHHSPTRREGATSQLTIFIYLYSPPPPHTHKQTTKSGLDGPILIIRHLPDCLLDRGHRVETCTVSPLAHSHDSPPIFRPVRHILQTIAPICYPFGSARFNGRHLDVSQHVSLAPLLPAPPPRDVR